MSRGLCLPGWDPSGDPSGHRAPTSVKFPRALGSRVPVLYNAPEPLGELPEDWEHDRCQGDDLHTVPRGGGRVGAQPSVGRVEQSWEGWALSRHTHLVTLGAWCSGGGQAGPVVLLWFLPCSRGHPQTCPSQLIPEAATVQPDARSPPATRGVSGRRHTCPSSRGALCLWLQGAHSLSFCPPQTSGFPLHRHPLTTGVPAPSPRLSLSRVPDTPHTRW